MAQAVSDADFEAEVLKNDGLVLVDFWAEWCGPCRALSPVIDAIAEESKTVKIVKVNIDQSPKAPTQYGVRSIPTLMLFKGGQHVDTRIGVLTKDAIISWLAENA